MSLTDHNHLGEKLFSFTTRPKPLRSKIYVFGQNRNPDDDESWRMRFNRAATKVDIHDFHILGVLYSTVYMGAADGTAKTTRDSAFTTCGLAVNQSDMKKLVDLGYVSRQPGDGSYWKITAPGIKIYQLLYYAEEESMFLAARGQASVAHMTPDQVIGLRRRQLAGDDVAGRKGGDDSMSAVRHAQLQVQLEEMEERINRRLDNLYKVVELALKRLDAQVEEQDDEDSDA